MPSKIFKAQNARAVLQQRSTQLINQIREQRLTMDEFRTVKCFRDVIAEHGITRPLLAFANRDSMLSEVIPVIPATESLDVVPMSQRARAHLAAIEGLDDALDKETPIAGSWVRKIANDLDQMLAGTEDVASNLDESVNAMITELSTHELSETTLGTTVVTARTVQGYDAILCAVDKQIQKISTVDVDALLTSAEYRQANAAFIGALVDEFRPMIGYTLEADNFVHAGSDAIDEAYQPREASLTDLGVSADTLSEVLGHTCELLSTIGELCAKRSEIVNCLIQVADRLETPETELSVDVAEVHQLVSNYAMVITMLVGDGLHHAHEVMAMVEDALEDASERSDDGRSD